MPTIKEMMEKSRELDKLIEEWDEEFLLNGKNFSKEQQNDLENKFDALTRATRKLRISLRKIEN